jgi:hypothetical protein
VPSKGNVLLKKLAEQTPSGVDELKLYYDDECQKGIDVYNMNGQHEEANALMQRRERVLSSSSAPMDIDDDDDDL